MVRTRFHDKTPTFLSWRGLRKAARNRVAVWVEKQEFEKPLDGWVSVPTITPTGINLGRITVAKPPSSLHSDLLSGVAVNQAFVSVFETAPRVKVMPRTFTRGFPEVSIEAGDHVVLFIEEPSDQSGDRCLAYYTQFRQHERSWFGSADVQRVLESSIRATTITKLAQIMEEAQRHSWQTHLGDRELEIILNCVDAHHRARKKKARTAWIEWEKGRVKSDD
jgi:hypothetical protein